MVTGSDLGTTEIAANLNINELVQEMGNLNLKVNETKTSTMIFNFKMPLPFDAAILIGDKPTENVITANFLGLVIDCKLTWHNHVEKITKKVALLYYVGWCAIVIEPM